MLSFLWLSREGEALRSVPFTATKMTLSSRAGVVVVFYNRPVSPSGGKDVFDLMFLILNNRQEVKTPATNHIAPLPFVTVLRAVRRGWVF